MEIVEYLKVQPTGKVLRGKFIPTASTQLSGGLGEKNVWTSDKSWEPGSFLMFSYVFQCFLTFSNVTYSHSHSHSLSLSHSLTLSHSHTLSISHWITLDMLNNFCFHLYAQNSLSHSLTLTLSHSHTLSISHSITLDMLNNFCFHLYAQKSLFIGENCNAFFSWEPALWTLM